LIGTLCYIFVMKSGGHTLPFLMAVTAAIGAAIAAEDTWEKVRGLKSGTELRITRDGAKQPILADMDHATEDRLYIATKKAQLTIPKGEIQRLEYRQKGGSRLNKQTSVTSTAPGNPAPSDQRIGGGAPGPSHSSSTSLSIGSKPDFETIYSRLPNSPKK